MEITDVQVRLMPDDGRLRAYCSITLDNQFVIKDVRVIDGNDGLFMAMPCRKLEDRCGKCGGKNHRLARFCNECGAKLAEDPLPQDYRGKPKLTIDIAHPINAQCRQRFEQQILEAFDRESQASQQPGYKPRFDDPLAPQPESPE